MLDCKVFVLSQWEWHGSAFHNRFAFTEDGKTVYSDLRKTHRSSSNILKTYSAQLVPRLTITME
jgi:hypothetical protein